MTCSCAFLCLGCNEHGGGARERSVISPACSRMGFPVRLVWGRPAHLYSVEGSGCAQRKCVRCMTEFSLINSELLITAWCFFCSWWNFDRKCIPSSLPSQKTKRFRQTLHLLTGTRYLSPNDEWHTGEKSFTCSLERQPVKSVPGQMRIMVPSTFTPRLLMSVFASTMLKNRFGEKADPVSVCAKN